MKKFCALFLGTVFYLTMIVSASAQMAGGSNPEMQQKVAALKQSMAENKQKLRQYQWVETQQITLKGEQKPERVFQCSYGPERAGAEGSDGQSAAAAG